MINSYQKTVTNSAKEKYDNESLLLLGLAEETGEVIGIFKKAGRDQKEIDRTHLVEELGDVLWYLVNIGVRHNINFKDIINFNKAKSIARNVNIRSTIIGYRTDELTGEEVPIFEEDLDENSEYKKSLH